ncbi:hypothetical protein GCM10010411_94910 [Actinomadura fulvescens]|uniref:Uncharacterized protein n=1 Tax=Actinomadura fulvescens TaxID=46160 RepID=A0ABP6DA67_9ACTN
MADKALAEAERVRRVRRVDAVDISAVAEMISDGGVDAAEVVLSGCRIGWWVVRLGGERRSTSGRSGP